MDKIGQTAENHKNKCEWGLSKGQHRCDIVNAEWTYHGHDLTDSGVRNAQLVDNGGQDKGDTPTANAVRNPDHKEGHECWIFEQRDRLLPIECFGLHSGCLFW